MEFHCTSVHERFLPFFYSLCRCVCMCVCVSVRVRVHMNSGNHNRFALLYGCQYSLIDISLVLHRSRLNLIRNYNYNCSAVLQRQLGGVFTSFSPAVTLTSDDHVCECAFASLFSGAFKKPFGVADNHANVVIPMYIFLELTISGPG